ncbi:hypothetical protein MICA_2274 [Micavibrio aeruginosavorus ARL-13]|uniref:Uncharacterized protein n=1 Tax=Micavibrio aeruginosavorus (strain ARL-13) TaxID=856793 RepID=G2KT33_MICAA|nr:hypothetical protein MICA_2274 [Micavibrio aeruginosavorus ARL-13]
MKSVIPAKAGIFCRHHSSKNFLNLRKIPACAGMTKIKSVLIRVHLWFFFYSLCR